MGSNAHYVVEALRERHARYQSELTAIQCGEDKVLVLRGVKHRLGAGAGQRGGRSTSSAREAAAFFYALSQGHLPSLKYMCEKRYAKLTQRENGSGRSALCVAVDGGHVDVVRYLIAMKAQIDVPPCHGRVTQLKGYYDNVYDAPLPTFYENEVPRGVCGSSGDKETLLHRAAAMGHADVCAVLIGEGADVNARTSDGGTPLMLAASGTTPTVMDTADVGDKHKEVIELLVKQKNIKLHVARKRGESVFDVCRARGGSEDIHAILMHCLHEQTVRFAAWWMRLYRDGRVHNRNYALSV